MSLTRGLLPAVVLAAIGSVACNAQPAGNAVGIASWYGPGFHGRTTANGEVYNQDELTAATREFPLGTTLRVTSHSTGRSVLVRVNDRIGTRAAIIDLSKSAARQIGLLGRGRDMVTIRPAADEPIEVAEAPDDDEPLVPALRRPIAAHGPAHLVHGGRGHTRHRSRL